LAISFFVRRRGSDRAREVLDEPPAIRPGHGNQLIKEDSGRVRFSIVMAASILYRRGTQESERGTSVTQPANDTTFVTTTLKDLMVPGTELDVVLNEYQKVKNDPERVGLCHDIAVAIITDLHGLRRADGWVWCRGLVDGVDGSVEHSWVEYRGLLVDMGDNHRLRVSPESAPPFRIDGDIVRRSADDTVAWAAAQERQWIAEAAYFRWVNRGRDDGHDLDDWLAAEMDIRLR
jgi:Protein of unknown function (DUF2934)